MDSLSEFTSQADEIARLNKQLNMVAGFYGDLLSKQHKELSRKIKNIANGKSKYKSLYEKSKTKPKGQAAKLLINQLRGTGRPVDLIKIVAEECFLSVTYVQWLWYTE